MELVLCINDRSKSKARIWCCGKVPKKRIKHPFSLSAEETAGNWGCRTRCEEMGSVRGQLGHLPSTHKWGWIMHLLGELDCPHAMEPGWHNQRLHVDVFEDSWAASLSKCLFWVFSCNSVVVQAWHQCRDSLRTQPREVRCWITSRACITKVHQCLTPLWPQTGLSALRLWSCPSKADKHEWFASKSVFG